MAGRANIQKQRVEGKFVTYFTLICQLSTSWRVRVYNAVSAVSPASLLRTAFFTFNRFSIWSLYFLEFRYLISLYIFFIYHTLKGSFGLWYYLRKKSVCQILIEISSVKVLLVHFCTKKFSTRGALGRFDDEVKRAEHL